MLTGKQKRYLRSLMVTEKAIFQIGKDGLSENLYNSLNEALKARELIKISILKTCDDELDDVINCICTNTNSELVQKIGKTIIIYRRNLKEQKIILP